MKMSKWFECQGKLFNLDKFHVIYKDHMYSDYADHYTYLKVGDCFFLIILGKKKDKEEDIEKESLIFGTEREQDEVFHKIRTLLLQTQEDERPQSRCY
jgi:hypothetical protein